MPANDGVFYTVRLNIKRIQAEEKFIDESFNAVIDDLDQKLLGIDHLNSGMHWTPWESGTSYMAGDVIRWPRLKSHQYAKCIQGGTSGANVPVVNTTGAEVSSGSTRWKIMSLTEVSDVKGGAISIWLGGGTLYERGDAVIYGKSIYRCKTASHYSSLSFQADIANWQEVFASIRFWQPNTYYDIDDTVIVDGFIHICLASHTSQSTYNLAEKNNWKRMHDYAIIPEWEPSTRYLVNQVVTIDGILYVCTYDHISDSSDVDVDEAYWNTLFASLQDWSAGTFYGVGATILYDNWIYKCTYAHVASPNFSTDLTNWILLHQLPSKLYDWTSQTKYDQYQLVYHENNIYRSLFAHTSGANFDPTQWQIVSDSINDWVSQGDYQVGQYVNYQGSLYKCITNNNDTNFTIAKWQKVSGGSLETWTSNKDYSVGDIVINAGKIYQCNTAHISSSSFNTDASNWTEISACITRIPNWAVSTDYVVGDLVAHDAKIYRCITTHTSDATQWDSAEEANWEELSPTINEISSWSVSTDYAIGQLVIYNNKLYRCNTAHTSDSTSFNTDIAYWDEIGSSGGIESWKVNELYTQGNMVVYNNKIYICDTAHTSTSTFDHTKWHEISSNDIDNWQTSTSYNVGDMVVKDGQLYRCITQHTSDSNDFNNDISNWQTLDTKWKAVNWGANTLYIAGEVVLYGNTPIKCTTTHISDSTYELDEDNWEILSANIREWVSGNYYKAGDTVIYENEIWKCTTANNSNSFEKDKWSKINKCNIEIWRGAPNSNILALLHFNNPSDPYYNEYGENFTNTGQHSGYFRLVNYIAEGNLPLIGGEGYALHVGSYGTINSPIYPFTNGTEEYTIECFVYVPNLNNLTVCQVINIDGIGFGLSLAYGSSYVFGNVVDIYGNSASTQLSLSLFTWYHFAYVISATTCSFYLDGQLVKSFTRANSNDIYFTTTHDNNVTTYALIDELMITNGAKYTSNFIVPEVPFTDPNFDGYKVNDLVVYEDKIYRCITANNDIIFTPSKWIEVSPCVGIEEWASGSDYTSGTVIIYNNNLYKVVNDITGATDTPDNSNDYVLLGGDSIKTWEGSKEYSAGTIVLHQNRLYRNSNDIPSSVTTFSRDDWIPLSPVLEDWTSNKEYKVGDFVIRNDILYECITDNNDVTFNSAKWKPISKEGINAWQSNKQYALYDLVVEDEELYMCISPHTSSSDFQTDLDAERWKLIGGGGGSGGDWNQVTKMNVVAPLDVDINIPYTNTFKRPPVEVLKYEQGTTDITTNVLNFGVGDGSRFEIDGVTASDSPLITFDGVAKPNHDILYSFGTPTQMVDKYYSESEEIDLDDFKVVGEVSLE